jgi:hypothetical protein
MLKKVKGKEKIISDRYMLEDRHKIKIFSYIRREKEDIGGLRGTGLQLKRIVIGSQVLFHNGSLLH